MNNECKCYHNCDDISCKLFNCDGIIRTRQLSEINVSNVSIIQPLLLEKEIK